MDRRAFLRGAALGVTGLALAPTLLMNERTQLGLRQGTAGLDRGSTTVRVPDFRPSPAGLHFANRFPHEPSLDIEVPGGLVIPIGDAANGLCGGMVYAVRDLFQAGIAPPPTTDPPGEGPGFRYLTDRLLDSLRLPFGPVTYLTLMNPALPDGDQDGIRGRAWRMVGLEWPAIRDDLDGGILSPLGLVMVKSRDPRKLGRNHQLLAGATTWTVHS